MELKTNSFIGFIDLIADGNLYDFKYTKDIKNYIDSPQLHVYKYMYEKITGKKIEKLFYVWIPKTSIRQKKTEQAYQFRKRLIDELSKKEVTLHEVAYDINKVKEISNIKKDIQNVKEYEKNETNLCDWCEYKLYCEEGVDYMILPENKKRDITKDIKIKMWIYGLPMCGKTYFANTFKDVIMLNTDGNIKYVDSQFVAIRDETTLNGRIKNEKLAWELFKETVDELIAGGHEYKTIVVDLLEDIYESCRIYIYKKNGIDHESDAGYGKGYDLVKTEFFPTMRKLLASDYNVILLSHEKQVDITKKNKDTVTTIKPNLSDSVATKIAGMTDIVARAIREDGKRTLKFKNDPYEFGGSRLKMQVDSIDMELKEFTKELNKAVKGDK